MKEERGKGRDFLERERDEMRERDEIDREREMR